MDINQILDSSNLEEIVVWSFHSGSLLILGGDDMAYYHQLEIRFDEVFYLEVPTSLWSPRFRVASAEERAAHGHNKTSEKDMTLYAIEDNFEGESTTYFVGAGAMSWSLGMVYHYARPDILPGERIAPWVGRDD